MTTDCISDATHNAEMFLDFDKSDLYPSFGLAMPRKLWQAYIRSTAN